MPSDQRKSTMARKAEINENHDFAHEAIEISCMPS